MYSAEMQARFTKSCMDAMQGYVEASAAASTAATGQWIDMWANAVRAMTGAPCGTATDRNAPDQQMTFWPMPRTQPAAWPLPVWPNAQTNAALAWPAAMDMWLTMTPFGKSPLVLQMAYGMMACGVSRSVAMPAAQANAATLDAAQVAAKPFTDQFSSYRSGGGHASAQIKVIRNVAAMAMFAPFNAMGFWQPFINSSKSAVF